MEKIFLSIIIPAYNEEARLPDTLDKVNQFVQQQPFSTEVLIIENGSSDRTLDIAQSFADKHPAFRAVHETGRGKGLAIKRGMFEACGVYCFMCDADLSMPISEVNRFLPPNAADFDIAIGSREAPGAVRYNEPAYRHIGGRLINTMIRILALPGLQDTQCGFKCFRSDVVENLFKRQTLSGWSFDVEILFIARQRKYRILEIPIPWYYSPNSKVNVVKDALLMGRDIFQVRLNAMQGIYD